MVKQLIKKISGPIFIISFSTSFLLVLCFLIFLSLNQENTGLLQYWIMLLGSLGVLFLSLLLIVNLIILYRKSKKNEIGSKLTNKLVLTFLFLTFIPIALIYYFSIQFLNKGIDSWFDVQVEQAIQDSLLLGQTSLESIKQDLTKEVETYAKNLPKNLDSGELLRTLDDIRTIEGYIELSLFTDDGRIIAFSSDNAGTNAPILPNTPADSVFSELMLNHTYTALEPISNNTQQFRVVAPIATQELSKDFYALQAIKLLPIRYSALAASVEKALNQYDQMAFARAPLKFSLLVTLSLISITSLLFSLLAAVYLAQKLVSPISNLALGTQRLSEGNLGEQLPITSKDELGILTSSFNNMSREILDSHNLAAASQAETEQQRGYLSTILTNLSSGVFVFDASLKLQLFNSAANDILGMNLTININQHLDELSQLDTSLSDFFTNIKQGIQSEQDNWQQQQNIMGMHGRKILIMQGTSLKNLQKQHSVNYTHYVVVFDDVTNLVQAQRDAAWGEVARRLAHEIKNPLTPIQLSAERLHLKLNDHLNDDMQDMLQRNTRTIVQQVEAMKEMVNDFSSYAQPVHLSLSYCDINNLLKDVLELHKTQLKHANIIFNLYPNLPQIKANQTALMQVFNNLLINAQHALPRDKHNNQLKITTTLATNTPGHYIDIIISDNGIGIPEDIIENIFEPYVSNKPKGSGLGLAIVKKIIEEHNGTVWANSTYSEDGKDNQTSIHIRLPIDSSQSHKKHSNTDHLKSTI